MILLSKYLFRNFIERKKMSVRKYMQEDIYDYIWTLDDGDTPKKGKQDRIRVDKDEGYEVKYFIEDLIERNDLETTESVVHEIEDALHSPHLSSVVMRDELEAEVESILEL